MSEGSKLTLPQAVLYGFLAAGLMIGVGVYLGMSKGQPGNAANTPTSSAPFPIAPATEAPARPDRPSAPSLADGDPKVRERAIEGAKKELAKLKPTLKAKCWDGKVDAARATITWNFTFESDGKTLARGTSEERRTSAPGVAACVGENTPMFTLDPPPGARVVVDVPFELP